MKIRKNLQLRFLPMIHIYFIIHLRPNLSTVNLEVDINIKIKQILAFWIFEKDCKEIKEKFTGVKLFIINISLYFCLPNTFRNLWEHFLIQKYIYFLSFIILNFVLILYYIWNQMLSLSQTLINSRL